MLGRTILQSRSGLSFGCYSRAILGRGNDVSDNSVMVAVTVTGICHSSVQILLLLPTGYNPSSVSHDNNNMTNSKIEPSLTKQLILHNNPKQKISSEAVQVAAELLRLFIVEARQRAVVEVCTNTFALDDMPRHSFLCI